MGIVKKRAPLPQCSPKVSFLIGLKQVKTFLLSFYVTLIHKNPKESNPKIGGLLRYRLRFHENPPFEIKLKTGAVAFS